MALTFRQFDDIINDIRIQPNWRAEADRADDYYDGNQLDAETMQSLQDKGMAPLITNLVKPTIDVVLGIEAKTRSDWRVIADGEEFQDVAEALSQKLHEAERESRADRACSDAYGGQVKSGIGWVEVSRESNPFKYPYRVSSLHRRELYWDWLAKEPDASDARYFVRKRWFETDLVGMHFPRKKDVLYASLGRWDGSWITSATESTELANSFEQQRGSSLDDHEWINQDRRRVCLFEVWHREYVRGTVLRLPDRVVEFDKDNKWHQIAIQTGIVKPEEAVFDRLHLSVWAGPHNLYSGVTKRRRVPYVPFFGFRESLTGTPYGLIRGMFSPQDEINARRRKLMNLLSTKRIIMDGDALDTRVNSAQDVADEVSRPDCVIVLNANRRNPDAIRIETDVQLSSQQFELMVENKQALQEAAGIYQAMLGDTGTGARSGTAINSLVEQGSTVLAELNDNYRYSRRLVGEMLVDMIRDDLVGRPVQVMVGEGKSRRTIILNQPVKDPGTGETVLVNDVSRSTVKVALEDTPSTPSYRAQQMQMLGQMIAALPPDLQAVLAPSLVEMSELPDRQKIADHMRKMVGIQDEDEGVDPEKAQLQAQLQEAMSLLEQMQQQPQMITAQARQAEVDIKAQKTAAEIDKLKVDTAIAMQQATQNAEQHQMNMAGAGIDNERAAIEAELNAI